MGVDCCLIGHTHIPYPSNLNEDKPIECDGIFNAGTHSQLDWHNNTDGECFIITLSRDENKKKVEAKKYCSGILRFFDLYVDVMNKDLNLSIKNIIDKNVIADKKNVVLRVNIKGTISTDVYEKKEEIYQNLLGDFLEYD